MAELLQEAAALLRAGSVDPVDAAVALWQKLDEARAQYLTLPILVYVFGAVAIVAILVFVLASITAGRRRARHKALQQQAVLHLLDEITRLANGVLAVDADRTEDFNGAIADSLNFTLQTLRGLVGTINQTSEQIIVSAGNTQNTAARMSRASDQQVREISNVAGAAITASAKLQDVAGRAEKLAGQAQDSVTNTHDGAEAVEGTLHSMVSLREQVRDASGRVKRLGESSEEISNIAELIDDIVEQTNILALNASIQASRAGDPGRGFAVVADEVQHLAERASAATRQIGTLVKTIQVEAREAVASMERSTQNLDSGVTSAEQASRSLGLIEVTSQELAEAMLQISAAAQHQSGEANKIAGTMQDIRELAVQTSSSAAKTTQAASELNTLSDKLRESVAGFNLPATEARTTKPWQFQ